MNSFKDVIKYLFDKYPKELKRGKAFENYCKWFLENDSRYKRQLKQVWLWEDWPGKWGRDKGIDLIAETHCGKIWAIQAKAYDSSYYVTKKDVDKFLSESGREIIDFRLLICTTNLLGDNAREVIKAQEKPITLCLLEKLEQSSVIWPTSSEDLTANIKKREKSLPDPHQRKALNDIVQGFEKNKRGQLLMACGTGKTLVGLWLFERLKCKRTLILVPSISLISQLYKEWSDNSLIDFDPIFVCSDRTVGQRDQMVSCIAELGFPSTTNSEEIIQYLNSGSRSKVIFSTYQSSPEISRACQYDTNLDFDLVIADEAHRCAGPAKSGFATIVDSNKIRAQRRLFMTATPKIFSENVKQKTNEAEYEIISMDDEKKFGPIFHKLTFSEAISKDLLCDYQVFISGMDNKEYREYAEKGRFVNYGNNNKIDARTLASQVLLAKAIKKLDLKKIISFHNKKKSAKEFIKTFENSFELISNKHRPNNLMFKDAIFGEMLQSKRLVLIEQFRNLGKEKAGLLANVKCLSEGVDIPILDGIIFVDPKGSEIDIVQAIGRVIRKIRKSFEKKIGTIIIPIFIDSEADLESKLEQSCFKSIWKIMKALRAHDDVLAEELDNIRIELGKRTYRRPPKLKKVVFDLPQSINAEFMEAINLKIIEKSTLSWNFYYGMLIKFKEKHSHCNVPDKHPQLGSWVSHQRTKYNKRKLPEEHTSKLESMGFCWDPIKAQWEEMFSVLCNYKKKEGHINVPRRSPFAQLGRWVSHQRTKYNEGNLSKDIIFKLESIGFCWDPIKAHEEEMFCALYKHKKNEGHCNVPVGYEENPKLGTWVSTRRNNYKKGILPQDVISKLESIGFCWDQLKAQEEEMFSALCKHKKNEGHCNVPVRYEENPKLGTWVSTRRTHYNKGKLSEEHISKLESIGFCWDPFKAQWKKMFSALRKYKKVNGHVNVPDKHSQLGKWVGRQRTNYNKGKLPEKHISKLESIGFCWDPIKAKWEEKFRSLCKYKKNEGHCNVPKEYPSNPQLGSWVSTQRKRYKKGKLSKNLIFRLESIGFCWDLLKIQ